MNQRQYIKIHFFGSSGIWSDKLRLLINKAHRGTEGTEINIISRRC